MVIKTLVDTPILEIAEAIKLAFLDYAIPINSEETYWNTRFEIARVDLNHSWGAFDDNRLVAFIIHGIDNREDFKTAFNISTGVIPSYRGKRLIDHLYSSAIPKLLDAKVMRCQLEVIADNDRAIDVYKRIGFEVIEQLYCYTGLAPKSKAVTLKEIDINLIPRDMSNYSWENNHASIQRSKPYLKAYKVTQSGSFIGYFVINPSTGYIIQLECETNQWKVLFEGIRNVTQYFKINNVHHSRKELNLFLNNIANTSIRQYEMESWIK